MALDERLKLVDETWQEVGYKVRAVGYRLWVRTLPHARKTAGGVWLSPKLQTFHGELPHLITVRGVVVSAGPIGVAQEFHVGDVVEFQRIHFGFHCRVGPMEDQAYLGFVDANQVYWRLEDDDDVQEQPAAVEGADGQPAASPA